MHFSHCIRTLFIFIIYVSKKLNYASWDGDHRHESLANAAILIYGVEGVTGHATFPIL